MEIMDFEETKNRVMRSVMDSIKPSLIGVDHAMPEAPQRWFKAYADFVNGGLTIRRDEIDPWSVYAQPNRSLADLAREMSRSKPAIKLPVAQPYQPDPRELQAQHDSIITQAREEGAKAERERVMGLLEKLKPHRLWFDEQRGAMGMWERMVSALQDEKGGE